MIPTCREAIIHYDLDTLAQLLNLPKDHVVVALLSPTSEDYRDRVGSVLVAGPSLPRIAVSARRPNAVHRTDAKGVSTIAAQMVCVATRFSRLRRRSISRRRSPSHS